MIRAGEELEEHLRSGPLLPVYLITTAAASGGPKRRNQSPALADPAELIAARKRIEDAALQGCDRSVDHAVIDYADDNSAVGVHQRIANEARSTSLFGGRRVVSVTHADGLAFGKAGRGRARRARAEDGPAIDHLERMIEELPTAGPAPVVLIFQALRVDRRARAYKWIAAKGAVIEIEPASARRLADYIARCARRHRIAVEPGVAQRIWDHLGGSDPARLHQTADRLLLDAGEGGRLGVRRVDELVPWDRESRVWAITDAIADGDIGRALSVIHLLVEHGEHPLLIVGTLAAHYRRLMRVDAARRAGATTKDDIAERLGIHPFVAGKSLAQLRHLRPGALRRALRALAAGDLALKSTAIGDRKQAERRWLEQIVLALIRGRELRSGAGTAGRA